VRQRDEGQYRRGEKQQLDVAKRTFLSAMTDGPQYGLARILPKFELAHRIRQLGPAAARGDGRVKPAVANEGHQALQIARPDASARNFLKYQEAIDARCAPLA
jgi:hypothetical protein